MFLNPYDYDDLCRLLGYQFKNELLLQQAITRKSGFLEGKQEKHVGDNERLEFFGDSILRTIIDDILMELNPAWGEGQLSMKRDELVTKNGVLFQFANIIKLDKFIIMGNGELENFRKNGRNKILSDTMEAILGALFIDSGKDYQLLKKFITKNCNFQESYNQSLIKAILEENAIQVKCLLKAGADPNTTGSTTISKYYIGEFCAAQEKRWGEDKVTLFWGGWEGATTLQLAIISKRVVPSIALNSRKSSPGRNAYIKNGYIYSKPLSILSKNPSLEDVFSTAAPIDLGKFCFPQNLTLEPDQPGYQLLQDLFESDISQNCFRILQLLLKYGADPNKTSWCGSTALHTAAYVGNINVIKLLLEYKADVTITNRAGNIPALEAKNSKIAKLLEVPMRTEHHLSQLNSNYSFFKENQNEGLSEKFSSEEKSLEEPEGRQNCIIQ